MIAFLPYVGVPVQARNEMSFPDVLLLNFSFLQTLGKLLFPFLIVLLIETGRHGNCRRQTLIVGLRLGIIFVVDFLSVINLTVLLV